MYWTNLELKQQRPGWEVGHANWKITVISSAPAGRIVYYIHSLRFYIAPWWQLTQKISSRHYAATCTFFPILSSSEMVQVTTALPHFTGKKWLNRSPLRKTSLLGSLPLLANEGRICLGAGGMSLIIRSSYYRFPLRGFLHLFCCCSVVPDRKQHVFRVWQSVRASQLALFVLPIAWPSPSITVGMCSALWANWGRLSELSITSCQKQRSSSCTILHPHSAGRRGLKGILKTASLSWARLKGCPIALLGFPLKRMTTPVSWSYVSRPTRKKKKGGGGANLLELLFTNHMLSQACNKTCIPCPGPPPG